MKIEILSEKNDWDAFLKSVDDYDFYHTYDYHHISKSESDEAILIKYSNNEIFIGLPLLIRKIEGTEYFDAISVYGYSGPIGSKTPLNFNTLKYEHTLIDFFNKKKIISVFIRLNPYLTFQNILYSNLGETSYFGELAFLGKIVNIDLTKPLEEQRTKYQRRLKNQVNKCSKLLTLKVAETKEDIQEFKSLYLESMQRLKAKKQYFFNDEYFNKFNETNDFKTEILLAIDNETKKAIAGCMFTKTNKIVQYHLSGSDESFTHLNGTKFLIDQMRIRATKEGYSHFNLGGGLGANENDTLFRFKSNFSDEHHPFFVWKLITNEHVYYEICEKKNILNKTSKDFFPMYRLNE